MTRTVWLLGALVAFTTPITQPVAAQPQAVDGTLSCTLGMRPIDVRPWFYWFRWSSPAGRVEDYSLRINRARPEGAFNTSNARAVWNVRLPSSAPKTTLAGDYQGNFFLVGGPCGKTLLTPTLLFSREYRAPDHRRHAATWTP